MVIKISYCITNLSYNNLSVTEADAIQCQRDDGNIVAQICLFGAQLIAGIGQTLKHTLGISYLDDNIKKSKTPALISKSNRILDESFPNVGF